MFAGFLRPKLLIRFGLPRYVHGSYMDPIPPMRGNREQMLSTATRINTSLQEIDLG